MPQLMPLSWSFASLMVMIAVVTASIIYSDKISINKISSSLSHNKNLNNQWCW